jgi:hypothetical protein
VLQLLAVLNPGDEASKATTVMRSKPEDSGYGIPTKIYIGQLALFTHGMEITISHTSVQEPLFLTFSTLAVVWRKFVQRCCKHVAKCGVHMQSGTRADCYS